MKKSIILISLLLLFLSSLSVFGYQDSVLKINYNLTMTTSYTVGATTVQMGAASNFSNPSWFVPKYAIISMKRTGTPNATIYATFLNSFGVSYSAPLNSTGRPYTDVTTGFTFINFTFAKDINLTAGNWGFGIRVNQTSADASNYYTVEDFHTAGGGEILYLLDTGASSWAPTSARDYLKFQIFGVTDNSSLPTNFTIQANNLWNGSSISSFNATLSNGSSVLYFGTTTGTINTTIFQNSSSLWTVNVSAVNYFNNSYPSYNVSSNLLTNLFQSQVNFSCFEKVSSNSLTCVNGTIYPNAGTYNFSVGVTGYYNVSTNNTIISLYDNRTVNVSGFYSSNLSMGSSSAIGLSLSSCVYNVSSLNYSWYQVVTGSPNTSIGLINGAYNISVLCDNSSYAYGNITVISSVQAINFTIYTYNSINITYISTTGASLVGVNISTQFIGATSQTNYTNTSSLYVDLFSPDSYTILSSASGYNQNSYTLTLTNNTYNPLTIYLTPNSSTYNILITVKDKFGTVLPNVEVLVQRWYNNAWITEQIVDTDFQGRAEAYYVLSTTYYNHVLSYNGVTYFGAINGDANKKLIYAEDVTTGLNFNIDILGGSILPSYQKTLDVTSNLSYVAYNNRSGYFRFYWSDPNNQQREGCLGVVNQSDNSLVYYTCSTTATGIIISSVINMTGNFSNYFRGTGYLDGYLNKNLVIKVGYNQADYVNWGVTGYIVALLVLIISIFGFIYSPTISLVVGGIVFTLLGIFGVVFGNLSGKDLGMFFIFWVITFLIVNIKSSSGVNR